MPRPVPEFLGLLSLQRLQSVYELPSRHCGNSEKESLQGLINNFISFHSIWSWWKSKSQLARKKQ